MFHDISRFYFAFVPKLATSQAESLIFALDFAALGGTGDGQHVGPTGGMAPHTSGSHSVHLSYLLTCFFFKFESLVEACQSALPRRTAIKSESRRV